MKSRTSMNSIMTLVCLLFVLLAVHRTEAQEVQPRIVDVVWLRDGSKLSGTILKWDLPRGMEFELVTGALILISKVDIRRVYQDVPFTSHAEEVQMQKVHHPRPYAFREEGMYHTFSGFFNKSLLNGAGLHYSIGHKFTRLLGVGIGSGLESHDLTTTRNIVPVYAEARGYFLPNQITPYYALKIGYGFALKDENNFILETKGGFHFSPEVGIRFGGRDVNYYLGLEYKLQNATFTQPGWGWGWGEPGTITDKVNYRRFEFRTGLVF